MPLADMLNPMVGRTPWRLFEIADQSWFPGFLRRRCQAMLAAQWTHRLPLLQSKSPAHLAAELILQTLDEIADAENLTVVDFCSGGGGPTPVIERVVNSARTSSTTTNTSPSQSQDQQQDQPRLAPLQFLLSDLHPPLDDWIDLCQRSDFLSFIPQPVDASNPPASVISITSPHAPRGADSKILRLFALSFHHFDDSAARAVLHSSLATSDALAIVELQDRRIGSLLLMALDAPLVWLVSLPWFWTDVLRLLCTYALPVLPLVHAFDGLVSCLRTRTFEEVLELVCPGEAAAGRERGAGYGTMAGEWQVVSRGEDEVEIANEDGVRWVLRSGRRLHTWPVGYMNYIVGIKSQ